MTVQRLKAPKWTSDAISSIIASHSPLFLGTPQINVSPRELSAESVKAALPVYTVRVPASRGKRQSSSGQIKEWFKPKRIAWRIFLEAKKVVNVAVELRTDRKKERYDQLQHGHFIEHTFRTMGRALQDKRAKNRQDSLGLVQIPALYFSALWLKGTRGGDYFVSLVNVPGALRPGRFYTRAQIVRALTRRHTERLHSHRALLARRSKSKFAVRDGADTGIGPH